MTKISNQIQDKKYLCMKKKWKFKYYFKHSNIISNNRTMLDMPMELLLLIKDIRNDQLQLDTFIEQKINNCLLYHFL